MWWAVRGLILVLGIAAPIIGFGLWRQTGGTAIQAIPGLGWGAVGSAVLTPVFALSFQGPPYERLKAGGAYVLIVLLMWALFLVLANRPVTT